MRVRVKLMGMLRDQTPPGGVLELPDGATIEQALAALRIPADTAHVVAVNGGLERDRGRRLADGDELAVLPPVGGG